MTKPIMVRDDGSLGPAALKLVEEMASQHKTQRTIAATLGMPLKKFEKLMEAGKGDNELRLHWERGFAKFEQRVTDAFRATAFGEVVELPIIGDDGKEIMDPETGEPKTARVEVPQSKASTIAMIYFTKAQLGWSEKASGPMIQDNRISITIPAPMERGALLAALGQDRVADFRKDKSVPLIELNPEKKPNE